MSIPVLGWLEPPDGPAIALLDQTRLPANETVVICSDVPALVDAIRRLVVRGAPLLGVAGAYGVALAATRGDDVAAAAAAIEAARPTAVNLGWGVRRAYEAYQRALAAQAGDGMPPAGDGARQAGDGGPRAGDGGPRAGDAARQAASRAALATAQAVAAADARASAAMAQAGLALVPQRARILTHCNTGGLVSAGQGTAFAVVLAAHRAGRLEQLWVDETRPLLQGARLTAYEARRAGLPHAVLADGAAGSLMAAGQVDLVLIGADRIAADGSVANKVGSYGLAVLARHHRIPFVVVAPMSTIDPDTPDGAGITIEQRAAAEVTSLAGHLLAPAGTPAHNPAFDVTPAALVTAIVTERGVAQPVNAGTLGALACGPDLVTGHPGTCYVRR